MYIHIKIESVAKILLSLYICICTVVVTLIQSLFCFGIGAPFKESSRLTIL